MSLAVELIDTSRLGGFFLGMILDAVTISVLAVLTYRRSRSRATYVFTLVVVNMVVFFVTYLMSTAAVSVNVGFGLFALFGILRFRTGTLPVVEMTYLFAGIALASFNAIAPTSLALFEAVVANLVVIVVLEVLGGAWLSRQAESHEITYERVELVHPSRRRELIEDLEARTGLSILGVVVNNINFLNDTARITLRVRPTPQDAMLTHAETEHYET